MWNWLKRLLRRRTTDNVYSPNDVGVLVNLPEELQYLIGPALRYGRYQFESSMFDFLDKANRSQLAELRDTAIRVKKFSHYPQVNHFLDKYSMTEYPECAKLYFLFGVMDHADLSFEQLK